MGLEMGIPIFGKLFGAMKQEKLANAINPQDVTYQTNPYAKQSLGSVQNLMNGRMVGAGSAERNIAASQANQLANVSRNATDASTALALGAAAQGQANDAYENLQAKEGQQKYGLLDNLQAAYKTMIGEGDKVYQDQLRKYQNDVQAKGALRNAAWQNYAGFGNDLTSAALTAATGGLSSLGGFAKKAASTPPPNMKIGQLPQSMWQTQVNYDQYPQAPY